MERLKTQTEKMPKFMHNFLMCTLISFSLLSCEAPKEKHPAKPSKKILPIKELLYKSMYPTPDTTQTIEEILLQDAYAKIITSEINISSSISYRELENGSVGYIHIRAFSQDVYKIFKRIVKKMKRRKIKKLIIDLRYNDGGYFIQTKAMLDIFLNPDEIITIEKYKAGTDTIRAMDKPIWNHPEHKTVILINRESASSSEIVPSVLQHYGYASVIGERTFGKNAINVIQPATLPNGDTVSVKYTAGEWLPPDGKPIKRKYNPANGKDYFFQGEIYEPNWPDNTSGGVHPDITIQNHTPKELRMISDDLEYYTKIKNIIYEKYIFMSKKINLKEMRKYIERISGISLEKVSDKQLRKFLIRVIFRDDPLYLQAKDPYVKKALDILNN